MNKQIVFTIMVAIATLWNCRNPETPGSLTFREGTTAAAGADTTPPVIGTQITFASVADTTLTVNWGAASDIATATEDLQYKLVKANSAAEIDTVAEIDAIPAGADLLQNYTNNDTTQNVSGLTASATYFFAVVVRDTSGNKSLYAPQSQTMAAPDTTPPVAGTAISFASVADTSMTVNWGAATDAVTAQAGLQYRLVKAASSAAIDTIGEIDAISGGDLLQDYTANDVMQNVAGLASSTTYFFAVVVRDVAGNKTIYAPQSQATNATPDTTPPVSGTAISFTTVAETTLTVNWGAAVDVVTPQAALEYRLVKATTSTAIDTIAEVDAVSGGDLLQNYTANDITQNVTGLAGATTYFFAVIVRDAAGNKTLYAVASQGTTNLSPPTAGTGISFSSVTETTLTVNWGAGSDAVTPQASLQYRLVRATTSTAIDTIAEVDAISGGNLLQNYSVNDLTENVTGLSANTTYYFAVVVRDSGGNKALYTPVGQTTPDTTPPVIGTAVAFANVADVSLTVNWGAATDVVTAQSSLQYRLVKASSSAAIDTIAEVDAISGGDLLQDYTANDLTQNVTGLSLNTNYFFAVIARDAAGNKALYAPGNQTTTNDLPPSTPLDFSAGSVNVNKITLTWGAAMDNITTQNNIIYEICRGTTSGECDTFTVTHTTGAGETTFDSTGLTADSLYFFRIRAKDGVNNTSTPSGEQSAFTNPASSIANWPDSDQATCYSTNNTLACSSGGTFPRQDGLLTDTPAARSYIGPTQHGTFTNDYTTTDTATNLVWKSCTEGRTGSGCTTGSVVSYTWTDAKTQCAALNSQNAGSGYAGRTDWRLPTSPELETLYGFTTSNPAITASAFPATAFSTNYWTATTYIFNTASALAVNFSYPDSGASPTAKTGSWRVRCVAAGTPSFTTFSDLGDDTVRDNKTNLIWQKCSRGLSGQSCATGTVMATHTWQQALLYCEGLSLAGRIWRLPSINEWKSIADENSQNGYFNKTAFPAMSGAHWSSTTYFLDNTTALLYTPTNAAIGNPTKTASQRVRCVATGP